MTTILQVNQDDLTTVIRNCLRESITEIKNLPVTEPLPDRIGLNEACIELGTKEKPASKAQVYKLTMLDEIPYRKFGKRLVFSRKELREWMERRTISTPSASDIMDERLSKSAKKHLK